jgi:hypothetical protein
LIWKKSLRDDFGIPTPFYGWASSPVVEGQLLLFSAGFAGLALQKSTGSLAWKSTQQEGEYEGGYGTYTTPVVCDFDGKRCGLFFGPTSLSAVDLATGKRVWTYRHNEQHPISDPIVSGTKVFLTRPSTILLEMTPGAPKTVWTNTELVSGPFTSVLVDGYVYGSNKGLQSFPDLAWNQYGAAAVPIRCVELATGVVKWDSAQKMQFTSACASAGKLIFLELGGILHIVDSSPTAYREISSADVLGGEKRPRRFAIPPVLCGGRIYCRNYAGDLVCVDVSN